MELYLQLGYGMMGLSRELFKTWGGGTAILSPRDLDREQLGSLSMDLQSIGGSVLLDPQFYLPRADHSRLISHDYWPDDYDTAGFADNSRQIMVEDLVELNQDLGTTQLIVPGERADTVNRLWLESQRGFLEAAKNATDQSLIATICLSAEAIRSREQIDLLMEQVESMPVWGYYLIAEHPQQSYLVDDPVWLANVLDLAAGLRRLGAYVIAGYSNHQQLIMACSGINAVASGTWMNVRSFFPNKFRSTYEQAVKTRAVWYYCPQALSEYRLPFLDIGVNQGLGSELHPDPPTPYADPLFVLPQPSAGGWNERRAFGHYLMALSVQAQSSTLDSFDETVAHHRALLDRAEDILRRFRERGVFGETRDFYGALDTNRSALISLIHTHGPMLRRYWANLI